MRYDTHLLTSVTAGAGMTLILNIPFTFGYVAGVIIGSLLPDIDKPISNICIRLFGNSKVNIRGMTHSLFIWVLFSIISLFIFPNLFGFGLTLGYLFHIIGDLFSISGIPLFKPFQSKKVQLPKQVTYKTSSSETSIFFFSFILLITVLSVVVDYQFVESLYAFKAGLLNLTSRF